MNISFAHLGHEECEQCTIFDKHDTLYKETPDTNCEECKTYISHKKKVHGKSVPVPKRC